MDDGDGRRPESNLSAPTTGEVKEPLRASQPPLQAVTELRATIFPPGPPRDGHVLRFAHVATWESQFLGIGRLTAVATETLLAERHAVDDAGLAVVFLQRHRVEVGLKLIHERTREPIVAGHDLDRLSAHCAQSCARASMASAWRQFAAAHEPYVRLLAEEDPGSTTFRYPEDRAGAPWLRAHHVDLVALESAATDFERGVLDLVDALVVLEPLPPMSDPLEARDALIATANAARAIVSVTQQVTSALQRQSAAQAALLGQRDLRSASHERSLAASADTTAGMIALAVRAEAMAKRIASCHRLAVPDVAALPVLPPAPLAPPFGASLRAEWLDTSIRWSSEAFASAFRVMATALAAACVATDGWGEPAARQLSLELRRMRSRLSRRAADM